MRLASVRGISMKSLPLSRRSILVVEDEPLIAIELRQHLENAGAYVFAATQLGHALQLAGHPDLSAAVLDCRLGQENTSAICDRLHERGIPFMFYSNYDDIVRLWPKAIHLAMPANGLELIAAVKEMCESPLQTSAVAA